MNDQYFFAHGLMVSLIAKTSSLFAKRSHFLSGHIGRTKRLCWSACVCG